MNRKYTLHSVSGLCLLAALAAGCRFSFGPIGQQLQGSGVAKTEERLVEDFNEIQVEAAVNLEIMVGQATSLTVTADDNILPHVRTEVAGDRLRIHVDASYSTTLGVKVIATVPSLMTLDGSGATTTTIEGVSGERFDLDLSGASSCVLAGEVEELDVTLSGASRAELDGKATLLTVDGSGALRLEAEEFQAERVDATLSGASTGVVVARDELTVTASGASTLRYRGEPGKVTSDVSGASTIGAE